MILRASQTLVAGIDAISNTKETLLYAAAYLPTMGEHSAGKAPLIDLLLAWRAKIYLH